MRVAVPDGFHPSQQCQELRRQGGSEIGSGGHGSLYNHHSFAESFLQVGFQVQLIEFFDQEGVFHSNHWDVSKGMVKRSLLFDERNIDQPFAYTSLVLDAVKPGAAAMGLESDRVGTNKMGTSGTQADSVGCKDGVVQHNFKREAA